VLATPDGDASTACAGTAHSPRASAEDAAKASSDFRTLRMIATPRFVELAPVVGRSVYGVREPKCDTARHGDIA
jgi:hypothetical protein